MTAMDSYQEAAKALLDCKLSGASRELCERVAFGGYEPNDDDKKQIAKLDGEIDAIEDEISDLRDDQSRLERRIEEIERGEHDKAKDFDEVRSLCLSHGVPLPN